MKQLKYINSQGETVDFREFDTQVFTITSGSMTQQVSDTG